jgi:hypothetical protein
MMNKYYSADGKISIFTLTAENAADFKAMEVLDKIIGDGNGRRGRKLGRQEKKFTVYSLPLYKWYCKICVCVERLQGSTAEFFPDPPDSADKQLEDFEAYFKEVIHRFH